MFSFGHGGGGGSHGSGGHGGGGSRGWWGGGGGWGGGWGLPYDLDDTDETTVVSLQGASDDGDAPVLTYVGNRRRPGWGVVG
jgi:hypothetical protein